MKKVRLTEKQLMRIVKKTINEESKGENYMFFSNLKQMRRQLDIMINEFDSNMVNDVLNNGHDWADDHITEAKVNIDQVFDFFMNKLKNEDGEYISNMLEEKWSEKYKKSIDCNNPKGFSQRAHCKGKLKEGLVSEEGKNCADTEKGCIRKRKSGWVILDNKKGGVWRKCDSKKHCEKILDAFHASN